jgi:hypothetical protein
MIAEPRTLDFGVLPWIPSIRVSEKCINGTWTLEEMTFSKLV